MAKKPPLTLQATTLWEYPSQHYGPGMQGDKNYPGATPSWVIWNLLERYTRPGDLVVDPMVGSGTTLDVAADLGRRAAGFDVSPQREDIAEADARKLPLEDGVADFVFVDPPYSTHIAYSDDPRCIGKLDALEGAYWQAMERVVGEIDRVLKPRRMMALYVSDSFRKGKPFMPIGFDLFALLRKRFRPVDIIAVVRHSAKLRKGNYRREAVKGNFFLRGFSYLFIMKKEPGGAGRVAARKGAEKRSSRQGPAAGSRPASQPKRRAPKAKTKRGGAKKRITPKRPT